MQFRLVTYSCFLCLSVALLVVLQYSSGPITNEHRSGGFDGPSRILRSDHPPAHLLSENTFISIKLDTGGSLSNDHVIYQQAPVKSDNGCRMDNCFDYTRCRHGFTVYIHQVENNSMLSESYTKILNIIRSSEYYTTDIEKACIYISGIDTLDRDTLSADYVQNLQQRLTSLPHWNNGRNHVIYNLYSGTWPAYSEQFGIDIGEAMLAKASFSVDQFRAGFDISLPLFHKTLPERAGEPGQLHNLNIPSNRKYLLAFKGKRYLTGVGSVSRNSIYHIHNGKDIIILTTCKHGVGWEKFADERCAEDNELYDRYDYTDLLANSTFCLVPRGRRLGSFRFLEVLQYGCIPVLLSDNWELPFSDIVDWKRAAIWADESLLYQLPYSLRTMSYTTVSSLQQQSQLLWTKYFSSFEKIVLTTLQIIKDRVEIHNSQSCGVWNTHPGAYSLSPTYSKDLTSFPYFTQTTINTKFTALVYITERSMSLRRMLDGIAGASHIHSIYLFVIGRNDIISYVKSLSKSIQNKPTHVHYIMRVSDSYKLHSKFPTDAVLIINQRDSLLTEEVDFAFSVWKEYPSRLVGYLSRSHLWNNGEQKYHYTSRVTYQYSVILSDTSVVHKYYLYKMMTFLDKWADQHEDSLDECLDLLLNFIISDITGLPPVKVGQRLNFSPSSEGQLAVWDSCMDRLSLEFGCSPLRMSHARLDPALFKDNVARTRKRYPNMEKGV